MSAASRNEGVNPSDSISPARALPHRDGQQHRQNRERAGRDEQNISIDSQAASSQLPLRASRLHSSSPARTSRASILPLPQHLSVAASVSTTADGPSTPTSPSPFLRSLLETADRIAQAPVLDLTGDSWVAESRNRTGRIEDSQREATDAERVTSTNFRSLASTTGPSSLSDRIRLTRRYTGRPHVPGEDSGSEIGEEGSRSQTSISSGITTQSASRSASQIRSLRLTRTQITEPEDRIEVEPVDAVQEERGSRTESAVEERDQENQRALPSPPPRNRFTATRPQESIYDWRFTRSELERTTRNGRSVSRSRSRSRSRSQSSVRRWRPAEATTTQQGPRPIILIDGRGDAHVRRDRSGEVLPRTSLQSDIDEVRTAVRSRTVVNNSQAVAGERSPEARRDLERALRDYRIARRALRSQSQSQRIDDTERDGETPIIVNATARRVWQSPRRFSVQPWLPQAESDTPAQRTNANDHGTLPDRNGSGRRRSTEIDVAVPSSILSPRAQDAIEEQRRERQFIREWVRNRPRNHHQSRDSTVPAQLDDDPIASGPLFNRDRTTIIGGTANGERNVSEGAPRFSGDRYRRLVETYKRLKKAEEEQESTAHRRAKATMQYITQLKECGRDQQSAWDLATCLGLHNDDLDPDTSLDLPVSAEELPTPTYSSWLQPGVVWKGSQCAGNLDEGARLLHARARRHRERMRREREERERVEVAQRQNESFQRNEQRTRDPLERTILGGGSSFLSWSESMRVLEDAERRLSSMLDRQNERLRDTEGWSSSTAGERRLLLGDGGFSRRTTRDREEEENAAAAAKQESEGEHWNVKVTIHEVDWDSMTLTGTMNASQLPDRTRMGMGYQPLTSATAEDENVRSHRRKSLATNESEDDTSMDSFFTGHIIDFRSHHTLHTFSSSGWKVGGLETDMSYWAGLGPFREEIHKELELRRIEKGSEKLKAAGEDKYCGDVLSEEERDEVKKAVMAKCLGSKKWLNRNLGEGSTDGWVLMRWKEQCFVTPGPEPNPQTINTSDPSTANLDTLSSAPYMRNTGTTRIWDTSTLARQDSAGGNIDSAVWGLTISGFYYVAMHRLTGRVEALYFDPGSQPYQRLRMVPEAQYADSKKKAFGPGIGPGQGPGFGLGFGLGIENEIDGWNVGVGTNLVNHERDGEGTGTVSDPGLLGLRSAFPLVELR